MSSTTAGKLEMAEIAVPGGADPFGELLPVLVVEDDAGLNRLIQKALQRVGFITEGALNGTDALSMIAARSRDLLLLLDYSLPDMTARELVETLQAQGCHIPFVVMTGYGDERIAVEMMKLNASDYLVKDAYLLQTLPMVIGEVVRKILMKRHLEETREALLKSEERYRLFVEMSSEGVWRCDLVPPVSLALGEREMAEAVLHQGRLAECNNAYLREFGHESADRALGTSLDDLLSGTEEEKLALVLKVIRAGGRASSLETMDRLRDGRTLWTLSNVVAIEQQGQLVSVWGTTRDITERRRAEDDLRRLAAAIEHAAETVVITDTKGVTRYVNSAIEHMFGHAREAVVGMPVARLVNGAGLQFVETLQEVAASGSAWSGRINAVHADGSGLVIEATASPIRDEQGRTEELVIILHDITKESALESQIRRTQKLEAIGTLAGGIAHDFNNILSAILGYTQMAMANISEDCQSAQDLEQVAAAGRRAAELVRQILTFGTTQEQPQQTLRMDLLAKEALILMRASIPSTVEMQPAISENCDCVMGDPTQIHQVIVNLCTNAWHAMEKQGGLLAFSIEPVTVDAHQAAAVPNLRPGAHLLMTVRDTGCGMDQAILDRAFDPFFTTKPQGKGTGLGLSIVHGIVKSHQGAIDIQSAPGKGTTVRVWFPTVKMAAAETGVTVEAPLTGHGERILFVDDEVMLAKLGNRVLTDLGYAVTTFDDANKALAAFSSDPEAFDLLVTDQTMPHCTGLELAARVRTLRPGFPVILVTGLELAVNEEDVAAAGVAEVLGKPVASYKLAKSVGRALAAARAATLRSSARQI